LSSGTVASTSTVMKTYNMDIDDSDIKTELKFEETLQLHQISLSETVRSCCYISGHFAATLVVTLLPHIFVLAFTKLTEVFKRSNRWIKWFKKLQSLVKLSHFLLVLLDPHFCRYCDCFARGEFCSNCNCINCANILSKEEQRQKAI